jgi:hypothetical protein
VTVSILTVTVSILTVTVSILTVTRIDFNRDFVSILTVTCIDFNRDSSPVLYEIASAFETFAGCFGKIDNNLLGMPIFLNPNIVRSSADNRLIDINFFGRDF